MGNQQDDLAACLDDIAKLLAIMVTKDCETQAEASLLLHEVGFEPVRIEELTGVKAGTVRKSIQRAKK